MQSTMTPSHRQRNNRSLHGNMSFFIAVGTSKRLSLKTSWSRGSSLTLKFSIGLVKPAVYLMSRFKSSSFMDWSLRVSLHTSERKKSDFLKNSPLKSHENQKSSYSDFFSSLILVKVIKFGLQNVTAGNSISLIGLKVVSTLIRVGLDLYRVRKVAIRATALKKHTIGMKTQKNCVNLFPRWSITCFKPWIVVVDVNSTHVKSTARFNAESFFLGVFSGFLAIAIAYDKANDMLPNEQGKESEVERK